MTLNPEIILNTTGNDVAATAWGAGQALARYILDHNGAVAGHRVVDLGTGGGQVAIAASMAGAAHVFAVDTEVSPILQENLDANNISNVYPTQVDNRAFNLDVLNGEWDILLGADVFYYRGVRQLVHALDLTNRTAIFAEPGTRGAPEFVDRATHPIRTYGNVQTVPAEMEEPSYRQPRNVKVFSLGVRLKGKGIRTR